MYSNFLALFNKMKMDKLPVWHPFLNRLLSLKGNNQKLGKSKRKRLPSFMKYGINYQLMTAAFTMQKPEVVYFILLQKQKL